MGTVQTEPGFYPSETGFSWTYLPEGAKSSEPPYVVSVSGPGVLAGNTATRFVFRGRGQERTFYRKIDAEGSWLLGMEEALSKTTVTFSPPLKEYPSPAEMRVGAQWGGQTQTKIEGGEEPLSFSLSYTFTITGQKQVEVPAGEFEAFTVQFFASSPDQPAEQYEIWFVPKVGEVRTREGLLLTDWSFK